jgi:hypothetical protein
MVQRPSRRRRQVEAQKILVALDLEAAQLTACLGRRPVDHLDARVRAAARALDQQEAAPR